MLKRTLCFFCLVTVAITQDDEDRIYFPEDLVGISIKPSSRVGTNSSSTAGKVVLNLFHVLLATLNLF